ncbi:MAG: serine hydrolase [Armatimonadota bacterium]|nr:serine hydrolase [Armatimonadota bacterium]MDR7486982.1 serine hydrolase [Armatimonadota bacterium]MDR7532634.1 serine hydrolase [Armatimonadota bacterium]MDR7536158.1 serine hydrolase [Armatimonadota bacterium]
MADARIARIDRFIHERMAEAHLPGLSLALVADGRLAHARGYGFRDLERGLPMTPDTLVGIGSLTKSFTCLALMQLQERGVLSAEDPVERFVPLALRPYGAPVRLWHLMSHASGLPALAYAEALIRRGVGAADTWVPVATSQDMLAFLHGADAWVHCRPGERWFYLNEGYVLLGAVVERASGLPYAEYVRRYILEPLGMPRTLLEADRFFADGDAAVPYAVDRDGRAHASRYLFGQISSDGGVISSAAEMARYVLMYLRGGALDGVRLASPASIAAMQEPRVALPVRHYGPASPGGPDGEPAGFYGYGLHVYPGLLGGRVVGHGGSVRIATAHMAWVPEAGAGVVVLANGTGYPMNQMALYALAVLLDEDPLRLPFLRVETVLRSLEGIYETYRGTLRATVRRAGDCLCLEMGDRLNDLTVVLVPRDLDPRCPRFVALAGGYQLEATCRVDGDDVEVVYERYKFRRVGRLSA